MGHPSFAGSAETAPAVSAEPPGDLTVSTDVVDRPPTGRGPRTPLGGGDGLPPRKRFGPESLFRWMTTGAGTVVLVIIAAIAVFLIAKAIPALRADKANFLTYSQWFPDDPTTPK